MRVPVNYAIDMVEPLGLLHPSGNYSKRVGFSGMYKFNLSVSSKMS